MKFLEFCKSKETSVTDSEVEKVVALLKANGYTINNYQGGSRIKLVREPDGRRDSYNDVSFRWEVRMNGDKPFRHLLVYSRGSMVFKQFSVLEDMDENLVLPEELIHLPIPGWVYPGGLDAGAWVGARWEFASLAKEEVKAFIVELEKISQ